MSFTERLRHEGLSVISTKADGNCLFSALRSQLTTSPCSDISAAQIRSDIVNFIRSSILDEKSVSVSEWRSRLLQDILTRAESADQYIDEMSQDGVWGDAAVIIAASELYQRQVFVYTDSTCESICFSEHFEDSEPIRLGYIAGNHYVGILPLQNSASTVGPPASNEELLEHGNYASEATASGTRAACSETCYKKYQVTNLCGDRNKIFLKRQQEYPWLTPTDSGGALCSICSVYFANRSLPRGTNGTFITKPFANWKKSTGTSTKDNKLLKHDLSNCHKTAAHTLTEGDIMTRQKKTVHSLVVQQSLDQQKTNLDRLADYFDIAYYIFKNEIPHTTHYSNMLSLVARLDGSSQMKLFMETSPDNATYTSHNTATEMLETLSSSLRDDILTDIRASPVLALLADESTDLRVRNELALCFRFLVDGKAVEKFVCLQQMQSTAAESIASSITTFLKTYCIPPEKIFWLAFDGAANMAGRVNGVQAKLKPFLPNSRYVHCRSHLLNLAAGNIANSFKPLKSLFSAMNSLWKFFHNSPKRNNQLQQMHDILNDPVLELVRTGDTRWTSNFRAVKAVHYNLSAIVFTLQEIHQSAGDYSSEAGGLLLTFQSETAVLLLFGLEQVLQALNMLTLILQSPKLSLAELPLKVEMTLDRLEEIQHDVNSYSNLFRDFVAHASYPFVGSNVDSDKVHNTVMSPYIVAICDNIRARFGDAIGQIAIAATVFNPSNTDVVTVEKQNNKLSLLADFFGMDAQEIIAEWTGFRKYLAKNKKHTTSTEVFQDLIASDVGDACTLLRRLAEIVLSCPTGTAGVERSFSTMNRICTRLRQRLTPRHLDNLLLVVQEGPDTLTRDRLKDMVYRWHRTGSRRIVIPDGCSSEQYDAI